MIVRWLFAALHLLALGIGLRWPMLVGRGERVNTGHAGWFVRISYLQTGLVALMVLAATAMARGATGAWGAAK
jgi:hypothetical protein